MTGALVVFGVMAAPATAQLTGNVKSVDTTANRLIVKETGTGTEFPIAVTGQTLVVTTTGKVLTLKDLRKEPENFSTFVFTANEPPFMCVDSLLFVGAVVRIRTAGDSLPSAGTLGSISSVRSLVSSRRSRSPAPWPRPFARASTSARTRSPRPSSRSYPLSRIGPKWTTLYANADHNAAH